MKRTLSILVALTVLLVTQGAWAQVPNTMSYQGVLHDGSGGAVSDGNYNITFALYNAVSSGSALWSETQLVSVQGGIFSVTLGNVTPLGLPFDEAYWLGVTVESNPEFTPRRALTSSAYSMTTKSVENGVVQSINSLQDDVTLAAGANVTITVSSDTLTIGATSVGDSDWTVAGNDMYSNVSGNIGIGTASPSVNLHIYEDAAGSTGIRLENPNTSAVERIYFDNEEGPVAGIQVSGSGAPGYNANRMNIFNNRAGGKINLTTSGLPQLTVLESGNVGVGTNSPTQKLQVDGTIESMSGGFRFPDGSTQTTAVSAPQDVYFTVKRDAAYDWPGTGVWEIDFVNNISVWENVGNGFDAVTGYFIAPVTGIYTFHGAIDCRNLSSGDLIYAQIVAGSKTYIGSRMYSNNQSVTLTVNITSHLDAGQAAVLGAFINAASPPAQVHGSTNFSHAYTYFSGALVR
jgi:hypothetical protein